MSRSFSPILIRILRSKIRSSVPSKIRLPSERSTYWAAATYICFHWNDSLRAGALLGSRTCAAETRKRAAKTRENGPVSPLAFAVPPLTRETPKENLLARFWNERVLYRRWTVQMGNWIRFQILVSFEQTWFQIVSRGEESGFQVRGTCRYGSIIFFFFTFNR